MAVSRVVSECPDECGTCTTQKARCDTEEMVVKKFRENEEPRIKPMTEQVGGSSSWSMGSWWANIVLLVLVPISFALMFLFRATRVVIEWTAVLSVILGESGETIALIGDEE